MSSIAVLLGLVAGAVLIRALDDDRSDTAAHPSGSVGTGVPPASTSDPTPTTDTCFVGTLDRDCMAGTLRTQFDVVPGVRAIVTGPNGFAAAATSDGH